MIKKLLLAAVLAVTVVTASGYGGGVSAASQSEGIMPTSGDLCNGTDGNGKITSAGNGTSSADTVVLCNATEARSNSAQLKNNAAHYKKVSSNLRIATLLTIGVVWLCLVIFLRSRKKSIVYILLFSVFYIYLYKVIDYTLLQYQSLLILKHFVPDLMLNGIQDGKSVNLVPLVTLAAGDIKASLLNILMLIPFGLGLPFITNLRMKKVVIAGALFSVGIELMQLITGLIGHKTFRVADINDVLFNALGAMVGYMLFVSFVRVVRRAYRGDKKLSANPLVKHIIERPQA